MAVHDRWHKTPEPGDKPCTCGRGRNRLYPSAVHLRGKRWQVRWDDPAASTRRQPARNFALKEGKDPELHADAFDKLIAAQILTRTYTDPRAGEVTLREFAETWRKARKLDVNEAAALDGRLRNHVYEDPQQPGTARTPKDGVSLGQHPMALLAHRPSMMQAWIDSLPLADGSAQLVVGDLRVIFDVAFDDNVVVRNPLRAQSVKKPTRGSTKARPWTREQCDGMRAELEDRLKILVDLGAATGMRQGEMLGLGVEDVDWLKRDDPRVRVVRSLKLIGKELYFGPVKNRKPHSVPLSPVLKKRLQSYGDHFPPVAVTLPWHDPDDKDRHGKPVTVQLLVTDEGKAVHRKALDNKWRRARRRAGITPDGEREREDGCHALRHTFVSVQLRNGVDLVRVASWIGDTVKTVAETYAHFLPGGSDDDGRGAVDGFLEGPLPGEGARAPGVHSADGT